MRLHVVSLPHTQTTHEYAACAYTQKVRKFCDMMTDLGHEVFLYAGEENDAKCTEHIKCVTKNDQANYGFMGPKDYLKIDFNGGGIWNVFNRVLALTLKKRLQKHDIVCVITGEPTRWMASEFPEHTIVEFGIGYAGICHKYRVFESYAWRNFVYGQKNMDGAFFDEVIPNYWDVSEFPFADADEREDYFLFIGRLTDKKGWRIAQEVCEKLGKRLVVAGPGEFNGYGEYVGVVDAKRRGELMSKAIAVFVPTLYIPPFEGVHIEANLCGTPVITTDFGVFSETVVNGVNGHRCKMFDEFVTAAKWYADGNFFEHQNIRKDAVAKYSLEAVGEKYEEYFHRLLTLWGKGWYSEMPK